MNSIFAAVVAGGIGCATFGLAVLLRRRAPPKARNVAAGAHGPVITEGLITADEMVRGFDGASGWEWWGKHRILQRWLTSEKRRAAEHRCGVSAALCQQRWCRKDLFLLDCSAGLFCGVGAGVWACGRALSLSPWRVLRAMHAACNQANSPGERGLAAECPPAELDRNTKQRHLTMMLWWVGARAADGGRR